MANAREEPTLVGGSTASVPTAFAAFYRERYAAMARLAFLLTGGDPAAEELAQDAFLGTFRAWDRVEEPNAYVRAALVNACRSHRRRREREMRRQLAAPPPVTQAADELRDVIGSLPFRQRAVVVLRFYEDLPEAEIATALGCTVVAVKSLLHRATRALREVIER